MEDTNFFGSEFTIVAGPCAVESEDQIWRVAKFLASLGVTHIRGGAYKPRTRPGSFRGVGRDGLRWMKAAALEYGLIVVSEVLTRSQLEESYECIDVVQIGSRNMTSFGFLSEVGRVTSTDSKPVLVKRGFASTLNELLCAVDYVREYGNERIALCLRGIRTFEQVDSLLRYTPDIGAIVELKQQTGLPIIFDPSHSCGDRTFVPSISAAAVAAGANGLLIEVSDDPAHARCDGRQAMVLSRLPALIEYVYGIRNHTDVSTGLLHSNMATATAYRETRRSNSL